MIPATDVLYVALTVQAQPVDGFAESLDPRGHPLNACAEAPLALARIAATPHRRANTWSPFVGRVVVDVMPKPEILDPQGKAVAGALPRLGFGQFASVRQGKRFELEVDGPVTEEILAAARAAGEHVLSNPVIEDVVAVYEDTQA